MSRIDELTKVAEFAKTAKTKKEVVEFGLVTFGHKADDTLVARTKKENLVDALIMRMVEVMEDAELRHHVNAR